MTRLAILALALLALASILSGCSGTGTLLYCLAVDHDVNHRYHRPEPTMKLAWLSLALALAVGAPETRAHQAMSRWTYPLSCCADNDCAQIAPETVKETAQGYVVTIQPGTHPMWRADRSAPLVVRVLYSEAKPSPDGRFHICLNSAGDLLCFFAAIGGS